MTFSPSKRPQLNRLTGPSTPSNIFPTNREGVLIGEQIYWNPATVANPHGCIIGGSGAGKTQTLKAIAWEVSKLVEVAIIDFHGDQELPGEKVYHINMTSNSGINPLVINLDQEGAAPICRPLSWPCYLPKPYGWAVINRANYWMRLNIAIFAGASPRNPLKVG
ncbi:DUF853 family protein (plasmid) [Synechocystis sp. B12]|nr:DUF853 family protein [Synechocystis sp. B12]